MILVTGATGFLGAELVKQLTDQNLLVRALRRSSSKIPALLQNNTLVTWHIADINEPENLADAFEGVTKVYHCAATVSFDPKDKAKLLKINIEGTANIVNLCLENNIRLLHVSSIAALGDPKEHETIITEETEWNPEELHSDYAISKYGAEMEVFRGHQEGLEVVIVNPGVIFGYGFPKKGSGVIVQSVKKGNPFFTKGNIGIVAVEDVVKCMVQLMKSNCNGERFTLVGENIETKKLLEFIAEELKVKKPSIEATKAMTSIAWRLDWFISKILNRKRKLTKNTAAASHSKYHFDISKIKAKINIDFQKKEDYLKSILKEY